MFQEFSSDWCADFATLLIVHCPGRLEVFRVLRCLLPLFSSPSIYVRASDEHNGVHVARVSRAEASDLYSDLHTYPDILRRSAIPGAVYGQRPLGT